MTRLNPYLNWRDSAREAMEFYQSVFGGELGVSTFDDFGAGQAYPGEGHKVMHSQLVHPDGWALMGADVPSSMELSTGGNVQVALHGGPQEEETMRGWFAALAEGGQVGEPLSPSPWGDVFGMVTDRHGTTWLFNIGQS